MMSPDPNTHNPHAADAVVAKLLDVLEHDGLNQFTASEIEALKEVAAYWLRLGLAGKAIRSAAIALRWLGFFLALYLAMREGILDKILMTRNVP